MPQDQDHVHPPIHAAPTLGVRKNMLPSIKNSAPTLGVDRKMFDRQILQVLQDSNLYQYIV
jgi:hypothetical protein